MQLDNYEDKGERQWNDTNNLFYDINRSTQTKGKRVHTRDTFSPRINLVLFSSFWNYRLATFIWIWLSVLGKHL